MELEPPPPPPPIEPPSTCPDQSTASDPTEDDRTESKPSLSQTDILRALEVVERDSSAIAESYGSLFASLRLALSEVTSSSVDHMQCFSDAAGRLQESVLDASTKGNRYINSCLRLNEEMKGVDSLATQLKLLRRNVDALDSAVNKLLRLP
ncbi:BLOC-1-related complex subunit 6 [Quercus lobata]|uniref:BLOC-1-related complex subunit 6 C-terminal helix domain-containing protein n=1 Tax=Quercus lobata TaxID=97700 RepID=A0A7N2N5K1_QUELO|nr:BLOC-1-related complex subunit 6 [Quercus lobata]